MDEPVQTLLTEIEGCKFCGSTKLVSDSPCLDHVPPMRQILWDAREDDAQRTQLEGEFQSALEQSPHI